MASKTNKCVGVANSVILAVSGVYSIEYASSIHATVKVVMYSGLTALTLCYFFACSSLLKHDEFTSIHVYTIATVSRTLLRRPVFN